MTLLPKRPGDLQRFDAQLFPPWHFVSRLMQLSMMAAAERHGELVADLHAEGARLGKAQVMRIAGVAAADEAGLRRDKVQVRTVSYAFWLA